MISLGLGYTLLVVSLLFFAWLGSRESGNKVIDTDEFLSARGSQNWIMIGLSLFASGMGIWILFGPSSAATWGGIGAVIGYTLGTAFPLFILIYLGQTFRKNYPKLIVFQNSNRLH